VSGVFGALTLDILLVERDGGFLKGDGAASTLVSFGNRIKVFADVAIGVGGIQSDAP